MTARGTVVAMAVALCATAGWGQRGDVNPHLGYLYPAGGRQGTVLRLTAGGQFLQGAGDVHISGEGVQATVIEYVRPIRPGDLGNIGRHLREFLQQAQARETGRAVPPPRRPQGADEPELEPLPDHPLLRDLDKKSVQELLDLRALLFNPKRQQNMQIAEEVLIEVTIDANAAPGDRELRVANPAGLTNPMVFQVGLLPEVSEREPNDPRPLPAIGPQGAPPDLPVLFNGQIMPGDVDRLRFRAQQGQRLVIDTKARHLVPYLADAVPGWFQATVTLYAPNGLELAFVDDYRFDPDPVLFYEIPRGGEYELEIHDSIYRGREDFVYRIAVGELPFVTQVFPLGGRSGVETIASIGGWNVLSPRLPLDTQPGGGAIRQTALRQGAWLSNPVTYAVDDLPECEETEPNDTAAQAVDLPLVVNGRIGEPGDVDLYQFRGRANDEVVAEVWARRLNSPLDSLVRLIDGTGKVLAWNDDHMDKQGDLHTGTGLLTHHADSYLPARLPQDGVYRVQVSDPQGQGGEAYAYRLRLTPPQPDFALRITPSTINLPAGRLAPIRVWALRTDGFDGDIQVGLKDGPAGFSLTGGTIPAGRDSVQMTLEAPQAWIKRPFALELEGHAVIDGRTVTRTAVPCDDMMQAFLYRHLTPAQEFVAQVTRPRPLAPSLTLASHLPVTIPAGGTAQVQVTASGLVVPPGLKLELSDPPEGVTLEQVAGGRGGMTLVLKADGEALKPGFSDNLIVEASAQIEPKRPDGTAGPKRRVSLGVLPAIPFQIVRG